MKADYPVQQQLDGKGSYVLVIRLPETRRIRIGKQRTTVFYAGYYAYSGSALRGFGTRIYRHLRKEKKLHWHIDYLLQHTEHTGLFLIRAGERLECDIARILERKYDVVNGFGSSDCSCAGHLFYSPGEMTEEINEILEGEDRLAGRVQNIIL